MTTDDILRMAREADALADKEITTPGGVHTDWHDVRDRHFAALVAAAEREACAQIVEKNAELCVTNREMHDVLHASAVAIRARGGAA